MQTIVRSSATESDINELMFLEKDATKRNTSEKESGFCIKRRKSSLKLKISCDRPTLARSWTSLGAASAPVRSLQGTLFNYGFKRTCVKFQRSFSETEATIKNAVQKGMVGLAK